MSSTSKRNSSNIKTSVNTEINNLDRHKVSNNSYINNHLKISPDAKWIQIYINGDEHFSGCRCVVNNRYYRNLDMFLNYLTERLKPSFGAFRNIYTPVNGHPVLKLEDLISKHKYVVAGNERFKKLDFGYANVDKKLKRNNWKTKNKIKISKAKPLCHNALSVFFHQNGNFKAKPIKVSFLPQDLESWDLVYRKISEVMKCAPLKRIYSLRGKAVQNVQELVNNQSYIIVHKHEVFIKGHYGAFPQHNNSSSKGKYVTHQSSRKPSSVLTGRTSAVYSRTSARSSKAGFTYSASSHQQENDQDSAHNILNVTELGNGVESLDSFNPHKFLEDGNCSESKMKIDLDDDLSGIFRSKNENDLTAGATEVEDSPETVTDLPVDLLDAEEVEDEITPDMERSLQHLSLDVHDEIVAYLPTMQNKQNTGERQVSENKYNLNHSQNIDMRNLFV